jgi:predicted membrane channel-forming protein YqfA (hemolysin III family)
MNIWTHLLPFIAFIFLFIFEISNQKFSFNGGVIYLYIFTSSILFLFSSIHHAFSCHSNDTWNCCYKLDLTGIMFELISATICSLHFMFHDFDTLRRDYIFLFLGIGLVTVSLSMFDFFISAQLNMFVMMLYATLFLLSFMSSIHWVVIAKIEEVQVISKFILMGFTFMIVGFAFFLAKFPECIFQRSKLVDYFFQSHIIWHLCCVGCVISYYLMMENYLIIITNKNNKIVK